MLSNPGESIGRIDHLLETGANDVMVVHSATASEVLIPYIDEVVVAVDLEAGKIVVDWQVDETNE